MVIISLMAVIFGLGMAGFAAMHYNILLKNQTTLENFVQYTVKKVRTSSGRKRYVREVSSFPSFLFLPSFPSSLLSSRRELTWPLLLLSRWYPTFTTASLGVQTLNRSLAPTHGCGSCQFILNKVTGCPSPTMPMPSKTNRNGAGGESEGVTVDAAEEVLRAQIRRMMKTGLNCWASGVFCLAYPKTCE